MPPLRSGRASKACELCRKHKTRCYDSNDTNGACLRCQTLSQPCSLGRSVRFDTENRSRSSVLSRQQRSSTELVSVNAPASVDERIQRLEHLVENLTNRMDGREPPQSRDRQTQSQGRSASAEQDVPPVFLIRNAAAEAGVQSEHANPPSSHNIDVISSGLVDLSTARSLFSIFHVHYGRWVKFAENASTDTLLDQSRCSPLLICSVLLLAVRHTTQELAHNLAPRLLEEAKRLISLSLLEVPQPIEFFQASVILSLWSTTVGQVLLSIDSWLLTGYALQQASASPHFAHILRSNHDLLSTHINLDAWCIWNHLCVAHLQYCVGTRRSASLTQSHIDTCTSFIKYDNVTNYETRMVAEVKLYWIIYRECGSSPVNLHTARMALQAWRQDWAPLFEQPRSQFLQMGFHFAYILAYSQSLRTAQAANGNSVLSEMIRLATAVIHLAMETTDERTRHLTDHIYHVITFSALTLCRIIHKYESKLREANYDIVFLDGLLEKLVSWLQSIGLPCHAASILGKVLSAQHKRLRPNLAVQSTSRVTNAIDDTGLSNFEKHSNASDDMALIYSNTIGLELYDLTADTSMWPEWDQFLSENMTEI